MKKRKIDLPLKVIIFSLIIFLALSFILGYIWRILTTSQYFMVKDIVGREVQENTLAYLKGKNIFKLDLPAESVKIVRNCSDCYRVRLARVLPDRIFVEFIRRRPVAFIKLYRYFAVDEYGVIFNSPVKPEDSELTVISGLETKIFGPQLGQRYENKELLTALFILKEVARNKLLRGYNIQRLNVASIDDITLQIPLMLRMQNSYSNWNAPKKNEFLEIKIGHANIRDKIVIMAGLINQERQNLNNIKYIDLRFNEPVIKFKEEKTKK